MCFEDVRDLLCSGSHRFIVRTGAALARGNTASDQSVAWSAVQAQALGNNYGRPIIGVQRDIEQLQRSDLVAFFDRHYTPQALSVAIVGAVTPENVERLAYKYLGDWAGGAAAAAANAPARPPTLRSSHSFLEPSLSGPAAHVCYYRPAAGREGVPVALDALGDVVSGSRSGRAYRTLVSTGALHAVDAAFLGCRARTAAGGAFGSPELKCGDRPHLLDAAYSSLHVAPPRAARLAR